MPATFTPERLAKWLWENRGWLFSGVGVVSLTALLSLMKSAIRGIAHWRPARAARRTKPEAALSSAITSQAAIDSWLRVEEAICLAATRSDCFGSPNSYMARRLHEIGILDDTQFTIYSQLSKTHNRMESARNLMTQADLDFFHSMATQLAEAIRQGSATYHRVNELKVD
jgi:hypothetical protein